MDWNITRGELKCSSCGRSFEEGEEYFSVVYDEKTEFLRKDFCPACAAKIDREETFSFWQTRAPVKDKEAQKLVDDDVIMNFFMRLETESDPLKRNFRYVLGLLLMRKRLLKFKDVERGEGGEALVLYSPREQQKYTVYIPQLTEEEIEQVTEEVGQILNVEISS